MEIYKGGRCVDFKRYWVTERRCSQVSSTYENRERKRIIKDDWSCDKKIKRKVVVRENKLEEGGIYTQIGDTEPG